MSIRKRFWPDPKTGPNMAWILTYKDGEGVKRQKTFPTQRAAKEWEASALVSIKAGTHIADRASVTIEEAAKLWLKTCVDHGLEQSTIDSYRQHATFHIVPLIGSTLLSKVTVPFVRQFEDDLREAGRSEAMVKRVVGSLGSIIADAQERGLAAHNAVREMRGSRKGRQRRQEQRHKDQVKAGRDYPTPEEMKAFLGALEGRWKPLLMTAALCGLRSSELRGLSWNSIDLAKRELRVEQRADRFGKIGPVKTPKSRRTLPIPAGLAQVLREWKLACPRRDTGEKDAAGNPVLALDLAFPNGAGQVESHANIINRGLCPAMLAAGVTATDGTLNEDGGPKMVAKYSGMHVLRHWFASLCINPVDRGGMGLSPKVAQERLGHASIQMTYDRYGHLFPKGDTTSEVDAAERFLLG